MAKRAAKRPLGSGETNSQPWLQVVSYVRRKTEHERYRLRILSGTGRWIDFASAWSAAAVPILEREYPRGKIYTGPISIDEMNYWAWKTIERTGAIEAALEVVNDMASISSLEVMNCFETMRTAMVLYPDGTINPHAMQQLNDVVQSDLSRTSIQANTRLIKDIQTARALDRLTNKHEDGG